MIEAGCQLYLYHYSITKPYRCQVLGVKNNYLGILVKNDTNMKIFLKNDYAVIGCIMNNEVAMIDVEICEIKATEKKMIIKVNWNNYEEGQERRKFERYPVSLSCDIKNSASANNKRVFGIIRNISYNGILLSTNEEFKLDDTLTMDVYFHNQVMALETKVVRVEPGEKSNSYGLFIVFISFQARDYLKNYLEKLYETYSETIRLLLIKDF